MKILDKQLKRDGFNLRQIARDGNLAIYEQTKPSIPALCNYEVVLIGSHQGFDIPGTDLRAEPAETYPPSEAWGVRGWTFRDKESAWERLRSLVEARSSPCDSNPLSQSGQGPETAVTPDC